MTPTCYIINNMFTSKNLFVLIARNAAISFGVVLITALAVWILAGKIRHLSDSVVLNHRLQAELQKRTGLFEVLKRDLQMVGTNDSKIESAFITSDNILGFVGALDNLATKDSFVQVYHFDTPAPSAISSPFPLSTISYSNSFNATMPSFSSYLTELNKLPYYTRVDGLSITSQDPLGWLGASTITYHATLFTRTAE